MLFAICLALLVCWLVIQLWDFIVAALVCVGALMLAGGVVVALLVFFFCR
jgi:hypothetical protein